MKKLFLFAFVSFVCFFSFASVTKNDFLDYNAVTIYGRKGRTSPFPISEEGVAQTATWTIHTTTTVLSSLCIQWIKCDELMKMSEESQADYRLRIDFLKDGEIVKTLCFDYEHYKPALEIIDKAMR